MRCAVYALLGSAVALGAPTCAEAQAPLAVTESGARPTAAVARALGALTDDALLLSDPVATPAPLVVHVHGDLEALEAPLRRSLARRIEGDVELGAAPPGGVCAAIERGHACVAPLTEHDTSSALVVFVGQDGRFYETEVTLPRDRAPAVRALSIALVDVRDAARSAEPLPAIEPGMTAPARASGASWVYVEREGGLFGRRRTIEPVARPTLYLRAVFGPTTAPNSVLVGPGIGLGLCVGDMCAVIEGDVPVFEERRALLGGAPDAFVSHRLVSLAVRLQYRPLRVGPVTAGVTWGLLDRVGNAWLGDTGASQLVNDLGIRTSVEVAIELVRPLEWVFEGGVDINVTPARWIGNDQTSLLLSDTLTGWGVTALRVRP